MKKILAPIAVFSAALVIDAFAETPDITVRLDSLDAAKVLVRDVCADMAPGDESGNFAEMLDFNALLKDFLGGAFKEAPEVDVSKPVYFATVCKPEGEAWHLAGVPTSAAEPKEEGVFDGHVFAAYSNGYSWFSNKKEIVSDAALLAEVTAFKGSFAKYPVNGKIRDCAAVGCTDEQFEALCASAPCGENPFSKLLNGVMKRALECNKSYGECDFAYTYVPRRGAVIVSSCATKPEAEGTKDILATPALSSAALAKFSADAFCYGAASYDSSVSEIMPDADEWLAVIPFDKINDAEVAAVVSNYVKSVTAASESVKSGNLDIALDKAGRFRVTSFGDLGDTAAALDAYKALGDLVRRASAGKDGVRVEDSAAGTSIFLTPCALCRKCPDAGNEKCAAVAKKFLGDEIALRLSADAGSARCVLSFGDGEAPEASSARPLALLAELEKEFPGVRPVSVGAISFSRLLRDGVLPIASEIDPENAADLKTLVDGAVTGLGECGLAGGVLGDRCVSVNVIEIPELKTLWAGFAFFQMQCMKAMMEADCGCVIECDGEDAEFDEEEGGCEGGVCPLPAAEE